MQSFVKNEHLDFTITHSCLGDQVRYLADFLISLLGDDGSEQMLVLEVKGDEDNRDRAKYPYARRWVDSANRDALYGK